MALAPRGVDNRQSGSRIVFRASLKDSSGAIVTSGTTSLYLYELQDDGTLKSYDFNDNTFKTGALTTATASMTHRQGNNSTTNTGLWTYALTTISGFTRGGVYLAVVTNSGASPTQQEREFQYGAGEGDLVVDSAGLADANAVKVGPSGSGTAQTARDIGACLGSFTGSGVNTVLGFFKALLSKTASTPSDVGGTFDPSTDSTEAIRDRGDAEWVTATGFAVAGDAMTLSDNAITAAKIATDALTAAKIAADAIGSSELASTAVDEIVAGVLAGIIEGSVTLKQSLQLSNAAAAGKVDGGGTSTVHLRDLADTKNRVTSTVDGSGNRSAVTVSYD